MTIGFVYPTGNGGHARSFASTFVLEIEGSERAGRARAWPDVLSLMYPSGTRRMLSVLETDNESLTTRAVEVPDAWIRRSGQRRNVLA